MGYIADAGSNNISQFKNGLISGTVAASFCVEQFGVERFKSLSKNEIEDRAFAFSKMITIRGII